MKKEEFINKCVELGCEWKEEEHKGKKGYIIRSEKFDTIAHFTPDAIKNNSWSKLKSGIVQGRDVYQMSRIVGYYSRIHNWNKSKIGELKDRQAGNYTVNAISGEPRRGVKNNYGY